MGRPMQRERVMARDALVLEIARGQWGLVSRRQALNAGVSIGTIDRRLRSGDWEPMGVAVYRLPGVPQSWEQRALAACLQSEPFGALSHRSAGRVWRLDGLSRVAPEPIELVVPRGHELLAEVKVRWTRRFERGVYRSLPVTPLSRTLIDLAAVLTETELEMALDSGLRFGPRALKSLQSKLAELPRKGRRGVDVLRELLSAYDGTLDSALEILVRKLLWAAGLPKPVVHFNVWHQRRWIANVDFAWPKQRLVVQAHGLKYHLNARRMRIDHWQNTQLVAAGWHPLTTTWKQVTEQPGQFIDCLRETWARLLSASNSAGAVPG